MSLKMKEPQYDVLLNYPETRLGMMTSQAWHDDPKHLLFVLARYKFVSKMLSGKSHVLEVGCGDGFASRLVQQEVDKLSVLDFDPIFLEDINSRQQDKWLLDIIEHDPTKAPVQGRYDAVYFLDVLEHIKKIEEDRFLKNIIQALSSEGVLVVGCPSLESQEFSSPQSKIGHVNCKSGNELKYLLEKYFHNVFLFSMNDEVVHTGFSPMAHYLFVLCCGKKEN